MASRISGIPSAAIGYITRAVSAMNATVAALDSPASAVSGRLTLTSGKTVLNSTVSGATTVYFTPYNGNKAPFWNGASWEWAAFAEVSQATTDATKSPAACAASSVYDVFLWNDAGTIRATRGPAWTSLTARGTGVGTSELQRVNGLLCNKNTIANGPLAGYGLYLGTIATNASSTIDFILGTAASGGGAASIGIWNNFNRMRISTTVVDNGAPYNYLGPAFRSSRASSSNRITAVFGLSEEFSTASMQTDLYSSVTAYSGIGFNSLSSYSSNSVLVGGESSGFNSFSVSALGSNYFQMIESGYGTYCNVGPQSLSLSWRF